MRRFQAAVFAASMGLAAHGAQAVIRSSNHLPSPITDPAALPDPKVIMGIVRIDLVGNDLDGISASSLSPYAGTAYENTALYHSVSAGAEARYLLNGPQQSFSLVFGSPDSFNTLSLRLRGEEVFDLPGNGLLPSHKLGTGAVYVMISDILFDEIRFASSGDSLEFTNVASLPPVAPETGDRANVAAVARKMADVEGAAPVLRKVENVASATPVARQVTDIASVTPVVREAPGLAGAAIMAVPLPATLSMLLGALAVLGLSVHRHPSA